MGDSIDGSSNAAHRAQADGHEEEEQGGFFRRIFGALSPGDDTLDDDEEGASPRSEGQPGIGNLRRMAVEDAAIPKADIVSVASIITKDELVQVFRDSGLTRLPVYNGTLDTPIGFVHLKGPRAETWVQWRRWAVLAQAHVASAAVRAAVDADRRSAAKDAGGAAAHGACHRRIWRC